MTSDQPQNEPGDGATRGAGRPPIIVGGCPRSGTTLLRLVLDSHPNIACGPELKLLNPLAHSFLQIRNAFGPILRDGYGLTDADLAESFGRQIEFLLEKYAGRPGARRRAEKTPQNIHVFAQIAMMLPESPLVHVIRDGRDVVSSLLRQRWINPATGQPVPYNRDARIAAQYWVKAVNDGRAVPAAARSRYLEIRYEDVVNDSERALRRLFDFVGEPWDPVVLRFHEHPHDFSRDEAGSHGTDLQKPIYTRAIGRWKTDLDDAQKAAVKDVAGALLEELGYGSSGDE